MGPTYGRPAIKRTPASVELARAKTRVQSRPVLRTAWPRIVERRALRVQPVEPVQEASYFGPNPYVDYARRLTAEGGIELIYKDIDESLRHVIVALLLWTLASAPEVWLLLWHSPVHSSMLSVTALFVLLFVNAFIVSAPVEIFRTIEIRPDCMILNGTDLFWRNMMEGWPTFQVQGNRMVLTGVYGTRFVEFLTIGPTDPHDESDRMCAVLARHLQDAIQQMWTRQFA